MRYQARERGAGEMPPIQQERLHQLRSSRVGRAWRVVSAKREGAGALCGLELRPQSGGTRMLCSWPFTKWLGL